MSRRNFLAIAGTAAGTGLAREVHAKAAPERDPVHGPGSVDLELTVNGKVEKLQVEPRTTLASALRDVLGLTGTKVVCDRGACGACTVRVGEALVPACMTLAIEVQGKPVTTIEGIAEGDRLHPVQQAFIDHDAMQCGFCTPGMVMSCVELLRTQPRPSLEDVKHATRGNLCRCGTYPKVFAATLSVARNGGAR